jgi:arginyl-tRNA synthetase
LEKAVMFQLEQFPNIIAEAAAELNPSVVANYVFHLAKTFNVFYTEHSINNAETITKKQLRIQLAIMTANALQNGMQLLGIEVPDRM